MGVGACGDGSALNIGYLLPTFLRTLAHVYWLNGAECYVAKPLVIAVDYVGRVDGCSEWL